MADAEARIEDRGSRSQEPAEALPAVSITRTLWLGRETPVAAVRLSHALLFSQPVFDSIDGQLFIGNAEPIQYVENWFVRRFCGRLLQPGEVVEVVVTVRHPDAAYGEPSSIDQQPSSSETRNAPHA